MRQVLDKPFLLLFLGIAMPTTCTLCERRGHSWAFRVGK